MHWKTVGECFFFFFLISKKKVFGVKSRNTIFCISSLHLLERSLRFRDWLRLNASSSSPVQPCVGLSDDLINSKLVALLARCLCFRVQLLSILLIPFFSLDPFIAHNNTWDTLGRVFLFVSRYTCVCANADVVVIERSLCFTLPVAYSLCDACKHVCKCWPLSRILV